MYKFKCWNSSYLWWFKVIFLAILEVVQESVSTGDLLGFRLSVCTVYVCLLAHPSETTALSSDPCHLHDTHAHTYLTTPSLTLSQSQLRKPIPVRPSVRPSGWSVRLFSVIQSVSPVQPASQDLPPAWFSPHTSPHPVQNTSREKNTNKTQSA